MERVVVVGAGLAGARTVAELRARDARRHYEVEVAGAGGDWVAGLPGASVVDKRDGRVVLELEEHADEQAVLDAARAAGRVVRFTPVDPTLTDLFRQVVA